MKLFQSGHRIPISLRRRFPIPFLGLRVIFSYTPPFLVHTAKAILGIVIPLLSSLAIPFHRLNKILVNASSSMVQLA